MVGGGSTGDYPVFHLLTHGGVREHLKKKQMNGNAVTADGTVFPKSETGHKISICKFPGERFGENGNFVASTYFPDGDKNGCAMLCATLGKVCQRRTNVPVV